MGRENLCLCLPSHGSYLDQDCMRIRVSNVIMYSTPLQFKIPKWQRQAAENNLLEFTATGISGHMQWDSKCYSPPFYTHKNGYKLRIEVHPDESKTTVGVYARLLKGEYDDSLVWPMNIRLTVEVLNWERNAGHIKKIIHLGENMDVCGRVAQHKESAFTSLGYDMPREKLWSRFVQYVQDDCIRIRVKGVIIYSRKKFLGLFT